MEQKKDNERVIDRLFEFANWCKQGNLCKSRMDFERICGLSNNYLYNTKVNTKQSIGVDNLSKIHKAFPMMSLVWVITGKGAMIQTQPDEGYRQAYEDLRKKVDALKKEISNL